LFDFQQQSFQIPVKGSVALKEDVHACIGRRYGFILYKKVGPMGALINQSSIVATQNRKQHSNSSTATAALAVQVATLGNIICHLWGDIYDGIGNQTCCSTLTLCNFGLCHVGFLLHGVPTANFMHVHVP